jgi:hypothetical protein
MDVTPTVSSLDGHVPIKVLVIAKNSKIKHSFFSSEGITNMLKHLNCRVAKLSSAGPRNVDDPDKLSKQTPQCKLQCSITQHLKLLTSIAFLKLQREYYRLCPPCCVIP